MSIEWDPAAVRSYLKSATAEELGFGADPGELWIQGVGAPTSPVGSEDWALELEDLLRVLPYVARTPDGRVIEFRFGRQAPDERDDAVLLCLTDAPGAFRGRACEIRFGALTSLPADPIEAVLAILERTARAFED